MIDRYYIADKIDELDKVIDKFWRLKEDIKKNGIPKIPGEADDIDYYFTKAYGSLENLRDRLIEYGRYLKYKEKGRHEK